MKNFLLWTFGRGSRPYDVICAAILAFIFLAPQRLFHDRPDYMRIEKNELVRRTKDDYGNVVYTVQVDAPAELSAGATEQAAVARLRDVVHEKFSIARTVPVYDTRGTLVAYSIWIDNGVLPF
jgi:hypothetical protein